MPELDEDRDLEDVVLDTEAMELDEPEARDEVVELPPLEERLGLVDRLELALLLVELEDRLLELGLRLELKLEVRLELKLEPELEVEDFVLLELDAAGLEVLLEIVDEIVDGTVDELVDETKFRF